MFSCCPYKHRSGHPARVIVAGLFFPSSNRYVSCAGALGIYFSILTLALRRMSMRWLFGADRLCERRTGLQVYASDPANPGVLGAPLAATFWSADGLIYHFEHGRAWAFNTSRLAYSPLRAECWIAAFLICRSASPLRPFGMMLRAIQSPNQNADELHGLNTKPLHALGLPIIFWHVCWSGWVCLACDDPLTGAERMYWTAIRRNRRLGHPLACRNLIGPIVRPSGA